MKWFDTFFAWLIDPFFDWLNRPLAVVHFVPQNHGHPADGSDEEPAHFPFWIIDSSYPEDGC
jgi:hypothetical protein